MAPLQLQLIRHLGIDIFRGEGLPRWQRWLKEGVGMDDAQLIRRAAELLRDRNAIDADLARIIARPVTAGHLGEWIASVIFDIELESSASAKGIDGHFRSGPLQGRTVNVKWYMKHQGLLDTTEHAALDYYLVLAGRRPRRDHPVAPLSRGASTLCTSSMPVGCAQSS